jgi:hypothetical protein
MKRRIMSCLRYSTSAGRSGVRKPSTKAPRLKASQKMRCAFVPIRTDCTCCGREYLKRRPWQRTCSRECQLIFWHYEKLKKAFLAGRAVGLLEPMRDFLPPKIITITPSGPGKPGPPLVPGGDPEKPS